ncbi:glutathione S-transferase family protein [Bordetella pseudohinzii]|uniref:Glutathione S-transferase n=1 Tax=Bordetella pseudohinzii TaxID=1331258 RepID=A0A0J6C7E4_9BORD|nr:glutathione binding-like protein [Bordetella pseudohinzii]ANY16271.1 glutathione S-transferase [Bordetella pseudohinzii]KMM25227.1 glutathione S-transferase [Bordetella pseudohinzii]KXA75952.1 glutathione S-transferase [Bordetella pseudohinzii]KXA78001.1 glutathione S-transferase [Bordetella pseudohinzii]CUJ14542.1 Glutathione S-transferase GST-4.5 [Bordetella pseudohinzii]
MKLYYMPGACSLADHIVLEWTGKPYETQMLSREALKGPEFLKINPLGAVPALVDGDLVLTQNTAILEYLAESVPEAGLMGDGSAAGRAETRRWLGLINSDLHKTFSLIFGAQRYIEDEAGQNALRASAARQLRVLFGIINDRLNGRPYLTGAQHSIADAYLYVVLRWAHAKSIDLSGYDGLAAFFKRMEADPKVQAVLKAEGLA